MKNALRTKDAKTPDKQSLNYESTTHERAWVSIYELSTPTDEGAVGWSGKIAFNDPGTSNGNHICYSVSDFEASWATQQNIYIPVSK